MSIVKKTVLSIVAASFVLFSTVIILTNFFYLKGFSTLEEENVDQNVQQVTDALAVRLDSLDKFNLDWSAWDDTYYFSQDLNEQYITNNLMDTTFSTADINVFGIYNTSGKLVYGKTYTPEDPQELTLPEYMDSLMFFTQRGVPDNGIKGLAWVSNLPVLVSCHPILTSLGEGPMTGYLVVGVLIDSSMIDYLAYTTHLPGGSVKIIVQGNPDFDQLLRDTTTTHSIFVSTLPGSLITGYSSLSDLHNKPAIILQVVLPRTIYAEARKAIGYLHGALLSMAFIFCGLFIFMFRKMILSRLTSLSKAVHNIGSKGEITNRVQVQGKDELSKLSENINGMLDSLEQSEMRRMAQKEIIGQIMSNTPNAVIAYDEAGHITLINEAFRTMFDLTNTSMSGVKLEDLPGLTDITVEANNFRLSRMKSFRKEITRSKGRGTSTYIITFTRLKEEELYILYITDISEERAQQESLYLTDRLASIGEMASGIAHELNNPLTSIMGLSEIVMRGEVPESVREDMQLIKSESNRAAGIVKNLLSFARRNTTIKQATNLNNLVSDVLKLRSYEHGVNNIKIIKEFDPKLPDIMVDNSQIQQVFINIILNAEYAIVHAHGKGTITIKTETFDDILRVTFTDDGPGIEPGNLRHIFDPFFTTKEIGKGTGLGLSISYGIVTAHGGRIYATSEFGKGATFFVELPLRDPDKKETKA